MGGPRQVGMVMLDQWVAGDHPYRKTLDLIDIERLCEPIVDLGHGGRGAKGFGVVTRFQCPLLQFMEDLSDRELGRYLQGNVAAKFFCGFGLTDRTPDYRLFTEARRRIGTKRLSVLFATLRDQLKAKGWVSDVFTFVDATHLISKAKRWQGRDNAIAAGSEKLNNEVLIAEGFSRQRRTDRLQGQVLVRGQASHERGHASRADPEGGDHGGERLGCVGVEARVSGWRSRVRGSGVLRINGSTEWARRGCHDGCIKRNNMQGKDRDKGRWVSSIRAPFERVFSKRNPRVRYRGRVKSQFVAFMQALGFHLRRLLVPEADPLWA